MNGTQKETYQVEAKYKCHTSEVGDVTKADYDPFAHFGGMTNVAIGGMFGAAQPLLLKFPLDRGIFLREYATQTYGAVPYFLSKSMVELPQGFLNAMITWVGAYFLMGLNGSFILSLGRSPYPWTLLLHLFGGHFVYGSTPRKGYLEGINDSWIF